MEKLTIRIFTLALAILLLGTFQIQSQEVASYAPDEQNYEQLIDIDQFNPLLMQFLILGELNIARKKEGIDEYKAERRLTYAARSQAAEMAESGEYKVNDQSEFADYVIEQEGTFQVNGVTYRLPVKSGKEYLSYKQVATNVVTKWLETAKYAKIIMNPSKIFIGIGAELDLEGRKVYFSLINGNYFSFKNDASAAELMEFPPSTKDHGLMPYEAKLCGKAERYNLYKLQQGVSVEDGIIYFETENLKELKKIIKRDSRDGLSIDIIQKEQYPCDADNLIDYDYHHRGILLKPTYATKLYNYNEHEGKEARYKLKVELGEIPQGLSGMHELNLVVIKDKTFCLSIPQGFLDKNAFRRYQELEFLADTISINSTMNFVPEAVDDEFMLRFPFNKGKTSFNFKDDIKPRLDDLETPPFVINEINIAAYTSIESSSNKQMIQIHKNAEALVDAFQDYQKEKFKVDITAFNGWSLFKTDVIGTSFENLAFMDFNEALATIKRDNLSDDLEKYFTKHRFANVQLRVIYDLRGEKEQEYVIHHFNAAIEKENKALALSIQKFIMKSVLSGKYDLNAITELKIPLEAKFAGLMMNKLWMQLQLQDEFDEQQFYTSVQKLSELAPDNNYISFNLLKCKLKFEDVGDDYQVFETQTAIDRLYGGSVGDKTVDALNLEYQFKIISALDTLDSPPPAIFTSLDKIKSIVNLEASSWHSSLQLAYLFIAHEDYNFARRLLEVFIEDTKVDEELLFTYLSLCSYSNYKFMTDKFENALSRALELNPDRFCELFDGKHFSLRVLENPNVKEKYCKGCNK